jgi:hypothetical protein
MLTVEAGMLAINTTYSNFKFDAICPIGDLTPLVAQGKMERLQPCFSIQMSILSSDSNSQCDEFGGGMTSQQAFLQIELLSA